MAKVAIAGTLSPKRLAVGNRLFFADFKHCVNALNHAYAENPPVYLNLISGKAGWGTSGNEVDTHNVQGIGLEGFDFTFDAWIESDVQTIRARATAIWPILPGTIQYVVGSLSTSLVIPAGPEATVTDDIDVTSIAGGWAKVSIFSFPALGPAFLETLKAVSLEALPVDNADIPSPPDQ